jgi:lipopolysaccharide/colanic/teichoic acid biosynthesis glycosyltransferase
VSEQTVVGESMKHLANVATACALLVFTCPLMALVALAIKYESPGPVFERRQRIAPTGRRFDLLTFRTTEYDSGIAMPSCALQPTPLGSFLQYTRIDALPQLINALRGEVSLFEAYGWPSPLWD